MFKTLRAKLLVFFLLTTFIPLLFVGYISYESQKQELTKQIEHSLLFYTSDLAVEIKKLLSERIADVRHLAKNPVIADPEASKAQILQQIRPFLDIYQIYSDTVFIKPDGIVYTSTIEAVIGQDISNREWFVASLEGDVYISDIYLSPIIQQPVVVISAPVWNENGEVAGVILASFDLKFLWETFGRFSEREQMVGVNGYAFLINKNGNIIAHPDHEKILTENFLEKNNLATADVYLKSKQREIDYNQEIDAVLSYAQIEKIEGFDKDWFVGITVSKEALFSPLQQLLTNFIIIVGLVLFLTTIAIFKLSKYIVSPVEKLIAATADFAIGKPINPLIDDSYKEINRLNEMFTAMTKKLAERERGHKKSTLIIETTDNGVIVINKQTETITLFNSACEKMFNIGEGEVVNYQVDDVLKKSANFRQFMISSKLINGLSEEITTKIEIQCQCDQKVFNFLVSVSTLLSLEKGDSHEELLIIISDLTEKRQMEQELIRSERLKIVGETAAGLVHEIRNPLAIIRGFIQLFSQEEKEVKQEHYNIILKEIDRVNIFVTDLLDIANPKSSGEYKDTNVVLLLEDLLVLQKFQLIGKDIALEKNFHKVPTINIDPSKVQQVCMNIVQNAIEAMKKGDCLMIGTKHLVDEGIVSIYIKDTGIGMDPTAIEKLGTPFYTTKKTGTGLGLTTTYRILAELKGALTVSSEKGTGSTFTITLPINKVDDE